MVGGLVTQALVSLTTIRRPTILEKITLLLIKAYRPERDQVASQCCTGGEKLRSLKLFFFAKLGSTHTACLCMNNSGKYSKLFLAWQGIKHDLL